MMSNATAPAQGFALMNYDQVIEYLWSEVTVSTIDRITGEQLVILFERLQELGTITDDHFWNLVELAVENSK